MFSFIDYTNEVFTISKELGVDVGVAYDILRADIRSGERDNTEAVENCPDLTLPPLTQPSAPSPRTRRPAYPTAPAPGTS